jgi:hypothetical protein
VPEMSQQQKAPNENEGRNKNEKSYRCDWTN